MRILTFLGVACLSLLLLSAPASAELTKSFQFNGKGNWSIDAIGGNTTPVGLVSAVVPTGSTIVKAYLYSSQYGGNPSRGAPNVTLGGTTYSGGDWTSMGVNPLNSSFTLEAWRTDVTAQMKTAIGGGGAGPFNFSVTENGGTNGFTDGEVLVVIYSNPNEETRTIALLDGFSATAGDTTTIDFANPLTGVGDPGFEALMSLGIGFGFQPSGQRSIVSGDGRLLTSSAGGQDDGASTNGGLITVGGLGDSSANPDPDALPNVGFRTDDELYDLAQGNVDNAAPFLSNGLTDYTFRTFNPSNDDNIFFLGLNITAEADVNPPIPAPGTGLLMVAGLVLLGVRRFRR